jgi:hypothetical protein
MKIRFEDDLVFWIVMSAVSLPICGAIGYMFVSGEVHFLRHPSDDPDLYVWNMNALALVIFAAAVASVSILLQRRRGRNSTHDQDPDEKS